MKGQNSNFNINAGGDLPLLVHNIIKEMRKKSKFINKLDVLSMLKGKYDERTVTGVFQKLEGDGLIF